MKKRSITILILSLIALTSLIFGGSTFVVGATGPKTTESLVTTKFVTVEMQAENTGDIRKGLSLQPERNGATAKFADEFKGEFSLEYKFLKDKSDAYGVKNISFIFNAKDRDESFSINVTNEKQVRSYIVCAGDDSFTLNGAAVSYNVTGDETDTIVFDPNTLTVSVNKNELWNFSNFKNGDYDAGVLFDGFSSYEVSVYFEDAKSDGKLLAYSLNEQSLGKVILQDNARPSIYAAVKYNGVVGKDYSLPKPFVYDVVDSTAASAVVHFQVRHNVSVVVEGDYEDGCSFKPTQSGSYDFTYTVKDSSGNERKLKQTFEVRDEKPALKFSNYGELRDGTVGAGESVFIPRMRAETELSGLRDAFVYVDIYKDGVLTENGTELFAGGFEYLFDEAGEYRVAYSLHDIYGTVFSEYQITVVGNTPYLTLATALPEYVVPNTRFTIPEATFTLGETTVAAEKYILYPNGAKFKCSHAVLSDYGYYKLIYTAKIGDVDYTQSRWIKCINPSESLFTGKVELDVAEYIRNNESYKGVAVTETIGQGGVQFNMPIDLTGKTKNDVLIDLVVYPLTPGETDFGELYVKFTDIYDEENYFTIRFWECPITWGNGDVTYAKAAHNGQNYVGVASPGNVYSDATNPYWGTMISHAFMGQEGVSLNNRTLKISMDYAKKRIYCSGSSGGMEGDGAITDLSDLSLYTKAWKGFTDGKCYVSVESGKINASNARYIINKIGDIDLSKEFIEYGKPTVEIDFEGNNEIPVGIVGSKYPLFDATATDLFGSSLKVEKRVYINYGTTREFEVDVINDAFTPVYATNYTVVYSATNGLNVRAEKKYVVRAEASADELAIQIGSNAVYSSRTGVSVPIADVTFTGNLGLVTIDSVSVTGKTTNAVCEVKDGAFVAQKADTYVVKYIVSDYLGRTAEKTYEIELIANDEIVFEELNLLPVYTVGQSYVLPSVKGYDFSNGDCTEAEVTTKVRYADNYTVTLGDDRKFTPEANHGDVCTVIYSAKPVNSDVVDELSKEIALLSYKTTTPDLRIGDYFLKENVTFTANDMSHRVEVVDTAHAASFTFAKPLMAKKLGLMFEIEKDYNAFNCLKITLTDSEDLTLQVELKIVKNGKTSNLKINDLPATYPIEGSFWGKEDADKGNNYDFFIQYSNSTYQIVDASGKIVVGLVTYKNGEEFHGFPSNKVYARFDIEGMTGSGKAAVNLLQFNNQFLGETFADTIKPELYVNGDYGGVSTFGHIFTLPTAYAEDVLGFIKTVGVNVTAPDGTPVTAEDGTVLNGASVMEHGYSFKVTQKGKYVIQYFAIDTNSNKATTMEKFAYCMPSEKPVATLKGQVPTKGEVGKEIALPDIDDAAKEKYNYTVYTLDPFFTQGMVYSTGLKDPGKLSFTPRFKGEYTVRYYIYDGYYNYIVYDYVITVS